MCVLFLTFIYHIYIQILVYDLINIQISKPSGNFWQSYFVYMLELSYNGLVLIKHHQSKQVNMMK